ncbi:hypothetical protein NJ959_19610 [Symplocastrum sp. BBK-W-15]|uniref:Uncharacterized protein n=1 Tax=Limnofasciculus baicalensis BBK-W-15 TaxID=2699891 RepID=A0AAE3GTW9_9CYAN|nr:hypothetical protein [Limnofasciculus baicalensis]MCP2730640.1 hypothetical protein [Limnofasciculus baicalensis BBK-W-15]
MEKIIAWKLDRFPLTLKFIVHLEYFDGSYYLGKLGDFSRGIFSTNLNSFRFSIYADRGVRLPGYYGKLHPNQWLSEWLLSENNAELRRVLIKGILIWAILCSYYI